jgi:hypothetical protein
MHRGKRRSLVAGMVATLVATGCAPPVSPDRLRAVDWVAVAGRDLNCTEPPKLAPFGVQAYDITDDGIADSFVAMKCPTMKAPQPYQVEVFDGSSDPKNPTRIDALTRTMGDDPALEIYLDGSDGCLYFSNRTVIIRGTMRNTSDPSAQPAVLGFVVRTWRKDIKKFDPPPRPDQIKTMPLEQVTAGDILPCPPPK